MDDAFERYTDRVTLCDDGVYRWYYDMDMYKNKSMLWMLLRINLFIMLGASLGGAGLVGLVKHDFRDPMVRGILVVGLALLAFMSVLYVIGFYIAAAVYEGYGKAFFRAFEKDAPVGDIHQIHGEGIGQREVFMTLSDKDEASRLICGLTWGGEGAWTSWPPHQHEKDLEEVYCYFGMPLPHFGFHISYLKSGEVDDIVTHTVHSGTMVQCPRGYHPTVASPGTRNSYFWVLGAFRHSSRRYDLAILDPALKDFNSAR